MAGNGAIAALVGITAGVRLRRAVGGPDHRPRRRRARRLRVIAIEKYLDDPVGALSAHGLAGIWGTLAVGIFGTERLVGDTASPGLWYGIFGDAEFGATLGQLGVQAVGVAATFAVVFGLSIVDVLRDQEDDRPAGRRGGGARGLDISTHGMYGYPEAFIPQEEYPADGYQPHVAGTPVVAANGRPRQPAASNGGGDRMKKIEAFIRHEAFEPIRSELLEKGFPSLSIGEVKGSGARRGSSSTTGARP